MEEKESQARALLDKTNRQFNECNALYHAAAQRCGLSDAAFWTLYALVTSCEPLTQNRIAADWGIPKQTLNSAVAAMVKKDLLALTTHGMKLYCISFILSGFNIFGSAFFTALNNGTVSAAISFLRTLLFQVVSILTLPLIIGVDGIWLAVVAAEAMALVCTGGFVVGGRKRYGYL